jgi:hypothetical protein
VGGITRLRRETKLLLGAGEAERLAAVLARRAAVLESRIVAVYFDSPGAVLARRAADTPTDCVKVRAKAYDPDRSDVRGRVVLEVKRERGGVTSKERAWLTPREVPGTIARLLSPVFGALEPTVASAYRRRVFQCSPAWRVTIDDDLRFHDADWTLFAGETARWHGALPRAFRHEPRVVVELKHGGVGVPAWLMSIARLRGTAYSKFAAATAHTADVGSTRA